VEQGQNVDAGQIALASVPIAVIAVAVGIVHNYLLDRRLQSKLGGGGKQK
jgi:uncharacterized membrane protein